MLGEIEIIFSPFSHVLGITRPSITIDFYSQFHFWVSPSLEGELFRFIALISASAPSSLRQIPTWFSTRGLLTPSRYV
jgi:hypothetical protein